MARWRRVLHVGARVLLARALLATPWRSFFLLARAAGRFFSLDAWVAI
jgi:hypothetical protein